MCGNQKKWLGIASTLSQIIDGKIKLGAVNLEQRYGNYSNYLKMDDALDDVRSDAELAFKKSADVSSEHGGMLRQLAYFRMVKNSSKEHGVANCGEYAGYVYWRLYRQGVFPIAFIQVVNVKHFHNHAFVAIGLTSTAKEQDMNDWKGRDIVICDPWLMRLLDMKKKTVSTERGAFTPEEYILATAKYFENGTKVVRPFGSTESHGVVPKLKFK